MKLFSLNKTAIASFSSTKPAYIAIGSAGNAIGTDFESTASLDIYDLNGHNLSSIQTELGFKKISWSKSAFNSASKSGLIATSQIDGTVSLYSGDKLFVICFL